MQVLLTTVLQWDEAQQDAWLMVTDLPRAECHSIWYSLRMPIEAGFKALKSGGFHWQHTRMTDPARAERLWLVLALASLRLAMLAMLAPTHETDDTPPAAYPALSLFKRGMFRQLAALLRLDEPRCFPLDFAAIPPAPWLSFLKQLNTYP